MTTVNQAPALQASARCSVAIIGSGVSGLTAASLLSRTHDVTLFEAEHRLGGHAHTHDLTDSAGRAQAVDSGFIVHNDRTYPWLRKLFAELGVAVQPTEMSMSVRCVGPWPHLTYSVRGTRAVPRQGAGPGATACDRSPARSGSGS